MTYTITKRFEFSAAHHLTGLRIDHPCARPHGHNYVVEVELQSDVLNDVGFVRDYGDLSPVRDYLDEHFDHRDLNEQMSGNPTAERLAMLLFYVFRAQLPELSAVRVSETPKTWAEYRHNTAPRVAHPSVQLYAGAPPMVSGNPVVPTYGYPPAVQQVQP